MFAQFPAVVAGANRPLRFTGIHHAPRRCAREDAAHGVEQVGGVRALLGLQREDDPPHQNLSFTRIRYISCETGTDARSILNGGEELGYLPLVVHQN